MSNSGFVLNVQASSTADNVWLNGVGPSAQGEAAAETVISFRLVANCNLISFFPCTCS